MKFFQGYDFAIAIPSILLLCISLVVLSSIDAGLFQNQAIFSILGIVAFIITSFLHTRSLKHFGVLFYIFSLAVLVAILIFGVDVRGARRWVELFGVRIQFSEFVKPFLILAFASLVASWKEKPSFLQLLVGGVLFFPIFVLLFRQPDLGSAFVFGITFGSVLFLGGVSTWYFLLAMLLGVASFPVIWRLLADYQKNRIVTFINPKHDPLGIGYNAIQSAIAVGSGLLLGRGLGRGVQSQLSFLPERHTDFIFATLSEEFGFVGSFVVLLLYFILLYRILKLARSSNDSFESYTLLGVFILLLSQTFINIGMNLSLVPITGVTLPLLSYGGSSLISTMILLGIVHTISRTRRETKGTLEIR